MPYTYIVQCADSSFYTGWTVDLDARLQAHNDGKGARYTRSRRPVQLVYWEFQPNRSEAQRREATVRRLRRDQKEALADGFKLYSCTKMTEQL
ncbi:MAG: methyltransferase [Peptococcaceae bacterium BRH_c4b]|nr:MAG: methyltransferase [Peptococcaceae bacterium BRH_c4b]